MTTMKAYVINTVLFIISTLVSGEKAGSLSFGRLVWDVVWNAYMVSVHLFPPVLIYAHGKD